MYSLVPDYIYILWWKWRLYRNNQYVNMHCSCVSVLLNSEYTFQPR